MIKKLTRLIWVLPCYFLSQVPIKILFKISRHPTIIKTKNKNLFFIGDKATIGNPSNNCFFIASFFNIRKYSSGIQIGKNTKIGNAICVISEAKISIGEQCLIGNNVKILDSDFHSIDKSRSGDLAKKKAINIGDNVFIGDNTLILKGVSIGKNSVVGAGSVVTTSFPDNSIIGGNPAKLIRYLE